MARGKTTVTYLGGILDGEVIPDNDTRSLFKEIFIFHKSFFAIDSKGNQRLLQDESKSHLWDHRLADVYVKMNPVKGVSGVSYQFTHTKVVFRCNAITKAGTRCKSECDPSCICSIHKKLKDFDVFKHPFNFVEINKEIK